jgi:hypothetical protein
MEKFKYVTDGFVKDSARTIDNALGYKKIPAIAYNDLASLENALKTMNLLDMQDLAVTFGVKPTSDRPKLVRSVVEGFKRIRRTYGDALKPQKENTFDPSKI